MGTRIGLALLLLGAVSSCGWRAWTQQSVTENGVADLGAARPEGKAFFTKSVLPELAKDRCALCHMPGRGYVRPAITYEGLLPYLAIGQSPTNNVLVYKLANQRSFAPDRPAHTGGQRCTTEAAEPCQSIQEWWSVEFGAEAAAR